MSAELRLSDQLHLTVDNLLGQRVAVFGTSGMGKSNTVSLLIEGLAPHIPIAIIDPHDEYYGLCEKFQFLRAGKAPGVDIEAGPEQAAQLAEFSFNNRVSIILSMLLMDEDTRLEFVHAFCSRLWELNLLLKHPYGIVLDEAQNFIPNNTGKSPALRKLKQFALEGRKFGFTVIISSQRTAEVNTTVRGQCGIAFLHGVDILPDVEAYAGMLPITTAETKKIALNLSVGECIVKIKPEGRAKYFYGVKMCPRATFDAGKTPTAEAAKLLESRQLDAVMIASLQETIADVSPADTPRDDTRELALLREIIRDLEAEVRRLKSDQQPIASPIPIPAQVAVNRKAPVMIVPVAFPEPEIRLVTPAPAGSNDQPMLNAGATRILTKLADIYPMRVTRKQIASLTDYTESGGAFNANWGSLKREGFVQETNNFVAITSGGFAYLNRQPRAIPATTPELLGMWKSVLKPREYDILTLLVECYPRAFSLDEIAGNCKMTASGGAFNGYIGMLRQNGLVMKANGLLTADASSLLLMK